MTLVPVLCSYKPMSRLPYIVFVKTGPFDPAKLNRLASRPYCFFIDSASHAGKENRYSYFGADPVRIFSTVGGFVTVDGHTVIDDPVSALRRFELSLEDLPIDPYLPFHGGLVGFAGHGWPHNPVDAEDQANIPDAWFGLFDTLLTFDHVENCCWISSMGLDPNGSPNIDLAKERCELFLSLVSDVPRSVDTAYKIKTLMPDPASDFIEPKYIEVVDSAKRRLIRKEWQHVNIARRFYAPVEKTGWDIHKHLRVLNPAPYSSFMRCGNFELSSTSPSCFLQTRGNKITCNVVQKSIPKETDPVQDHLNKTELLHNAIGADPVIMGDGHSIKNVIEGKPEVEAARLESDARSHYLVGRITARKAASCSSAECLAAALPGASLTGVPKKPVNKWLRKAEPANRNIYTGTIGFIAPGGNSRFNMAVRTMIVKDQIAFIHSGRQVTKTTNAEEAFYSSTENMRKFFEEIRNIGIVKSCHEKHM